jgi:hypothetical protein
MPPLSSLSKAGLVSLTADVFSTCCCSLPPAVVQRMTFWPASHPPAWALVT